ncbi:MAG: hypothetical protein M3Q48_01405 [Actinomycetota bacterium]|nr:hypothetical protein [Actinomycetota bacterium]
MAPILADITVSVNVSQPQPGSPATTITPAASVPSGSRPGPLPRTGLGGAVELLLVALLLVCLGAVVVRAVRRPAA